MGKKSTPKLGKDEITMFAFFLNEIDYDAMDPKRRQDLSTVLAMLLACVEGERIDTDRLAQLAGKVAGAK